MPVPVPVRMAGAGAGHAHGHGHGHGGDGPSADGVYAAQVTWDEAMADGAAAWVRGKAGRAAVVIAGNGHCHESAVVRRVERRGPSAVSVRPIVDDGDGELAAAIADRRVDFLFVMTAPPAAPPAR